jgi:TonB-linked SusC/RagA family outer membrane protein
MRRGLFVCLIALLLPAATAVAQQQGVIAGVVTDQSGAPLAGAQVTVVGTGLGTLANEQGRYRLANVPAGDATVRVLLIGFTEGSRTVNVPAGGTVNADFRLLVSAIELEGLVAVGYGVQQRVNLTGAVATTRTDEMERLPVATVTAALQGMAPGLQVLDGGHQPGRNQLDVLVRGQGTLGRGGNLGDRGGSRPLVLIDGIEGNLATVDIRDVESVSVLKDAAAAAIYGSRSANGVILVTTKRGSALERPQITYSGYIGTQDMTAWPERVDIGTWMTLANRARENLRNWCLDGRDPVNSGAQCATVYPDRYTQEYMQNTLAGTDRVNYPDTDWVGMQFSRAPIQDHTVRVTGGSQSARYAMSLNYFKEDGMMPTTGADRYSARLNTDFQASERISAGVDVSASRRWDIVPAENWASIFFLIHDTPPTRQGIYPDGTYGLNLFSRNSLAYARESGDEQRKLYQGTVTGRVNVDILPGWASVQGLASVQYNNREWTRFLTDSNFVPNYPSAGVRWGPNRLEHQYFTGLQTTLRAMLDYGHTFMDMHNVSGVIGYEQIANEDEEFRAWRTNFYNNDLRRINLGNADSRGNSGWGSEWALRSAFGRMNYSFMGRYLLEANARYDGSSRFAEGNRFGFFPSVSAGWRISEEPFFNLGFVNELKLRGSWGRLGNQEIPLYQYYSSVSLTQPYWLGNQVRDGAAITALANEEITWETTEVTNIGFDAAFLEGRLSFSGDVYRRLTDDILLALPIPNLVGRSAPRQNAGSVENKGWEMALGWRDRVRDVSYSVDFNLSDNRNKVIDLRGTGPFISGQNVVMEGHPVNSWYGWQVDGFFQSYEQIDSHARVPGHHTRLGDLVFVDQNGDGIINNEDRVIIGDPNPRYIWGMNLGAGWRNFDLSAFLHGVGKRDQYLELGFIQGPVWENYTSEWHKDHWTPQNPNARMPAAYANENRNYYNWSSQWVLDASFIKLRNVQLGYTLPGVLADRLGASSARLYLTGKNLWMRTNLGIDLDPEYPWVRADYYPQTKVFSIGTDIRF